MKFAVLIIFACALSCIEGGLVRPNNERPLERPERPLERPERPERPSLLKPADSRIPPELIQRAVPPLDKSVVPPLDKSVVPPELIMKVAVPPNERPSIGY